MKRINIGIIVSGIMFVFLTVNSFAAGNGALKVIAKSDKVFVKLYPSNDWTELTLGQMVHSNDVIKTDIADVSDKEKEKTYVDTYGNVCPLCSAVTLELPDKSSISLKADSEVSISELILENALRKLKINMSRGEMRMIITKADMPSDFSITTPNASYSGTGSPFYIKATSTGTSAYVADGSFNATNPTDGKTYTMGAGSAMAFNSNGTFTGPVPVSDVDVRNWIACYNAPAVEPYEAPVMHHHINPPHDTPERPVSGA